MIVEQTPEQIGRGSTPLDESSVAGQVGKEVHVLIAGDRLFCFSANGLAVNGRLALGACGTPREAVRTPGLEQIMFPPHCI